MVPLGGGKSIVIKSNFKSVNKLWLVRVLEPLGPFQAGRRAGWLADKQAGWQAGRLAG